MRHKYTTSGIVLARFPVSEASERVVILTSELGVVHAHAQSIRNQGAKLTPALQTFAQSKIVLVRGKEMWRVSGAVLDIDWFNYISINARVRVGRVTRLMLRLMPGDLIESEFFTIIHGLFISLRDESEDLQDAAECLAALRILQKLGLDAGNIPQDIDNQYSTKTLQTIDASKRLFVDRVNNGIEASGL